MLFFVFVPLVELLLLHMQGIKLNPFSDVAIAKNVTAVGRSLLDNFYCNSTRLLEDFFCNKRVFVEFFFNNGWPSMAPAAASPSLCRLFLCVCVCRRVFCP